MRWLAVLALLVAALTGCGDDDAPAGDAGGGAGDGGLRLEVAVDEPVHVGPVRWEVRVHNEGDDDVVLTFPDGQRADVVLSEDGEEVYRWSRARMFIQQIGEVTVPAGGERTFVLEDQLEVDPGEYQLTATLASPDAQELEVTRTITVQPRRR